MRRGVKKQNAPGKGKGPRLGGAVRKGRKISSKRSGTLGDYELRIWEGDESISRGAWGAKNTLNKKNKQQEWYWGDNYIFTSDKEEKRQNPQHPKTALRSQGIDAGPPRAKPSKGSADTLFQNPPVEQGGYSNNKAVNTPHERVKQTGWGG